jgi:hypothetical protein
MVSFSRYFTVCITYQPTLVKHWLDSKEIIIYKRYVDDILIMYDQRKTDEHMIL